MSANSKIEWTDATWNPVRGCTKISPGCAHCYAETFAERFRGVPGHPYEQGFDLRLVPEKLVEPATWSKSRMVFVNSMSDLFHDGVPEEYIEAVARVMVAADWHVYQVLTKRSERMRDLLRGRLRFAVERPHIWWGVSVENKRHGLPRVEHRGDHASSGIGLASDATARIRSASRLHHWTRKGLVLKATESLMRVFPVLQYNLPVRKRSLRALFISLHRNRQKTDSKAFNRKCRRVIGPI